MLKPPKPIRAENPAYKNRGELAAKVTNINFDNQVEMRAQIIMYETDGNTLKEMTSDYETHEIREATGVGDHGDASVHVQFNAGISSEDVIYALNAVIARIESHRLPETKMLLPRRAARRLERVQNACLLQIVIASSNTLMPGLARPPTRGMTMSKAPKPFKSGSLAVISR